MEMGAAMTMLKCHKAAKCYIAVMEGKMIMMQWNKAVKCYIAVMKEWWSWYNVTKLPQINRAVIGEAMSMIQWKTG